MIRVQKRVMACCEYCDKFKPTCYRLGTGDVFVTCEHNDICSCAIIAQKELLDDLHRREEME